MSVKLMNLAWESSAPSIQKLILLSICDNANDQGQAFLLIDTIATKCGLDRATVFRHIGELESSGCIKRYNRPGRSSVFQVFPSAFPMAPAPTLSLAGPVAACDTHPSQPATPPPSNPSQPATPPSHCATHNHLLTITNPTEGGEQKSAKVPRAKKAPAKPRAEITFSEFIANCDSADEDYIPSDDAVFRYAASIGLPVNFIKIAWSEFEDRYRGDAKRYISWRQTFGNAVRQNWLKLWFQSHDGSFALTTTGKQAEKLLAAKEVEA